MIDAASGYHQLRVSEESQELLTIVTNMGRFTFKSLPQDMSNAASLWNILTDDDARIDTDLNLIKNMDDWMLHARNLVELEQKLEKFLQFAASKNLKLKTKKFIVGSEVEFGGSVFTLERVKNQDLKRLPGVQWHAL